MDLETLRLKCFQNACSEAFGDDASGYEVYYWIEAVHSIDEILNDRMVVKSVVDSFIGDEQRH